MAYARGLDLSIGVKGGRYNSNSNLMHSEISGPFLQYGIGNYSISHSISINNFIHGFNDVTGYSVSLGLSPTFPIKTSASIGVGFSVNLSEIF